jgi:hypothetical protein
MCYTNDLLSHTYVRYGLDYFNTATICKICDVECSCKTGKHVFSARSLCLIVLHQSMWNIKV